jgi:hypothetical protein
LSRQVRSRPPDAVLTGGDRPGRSLAGGGLLVRGFRDFLGVELPPGSAEFFGTKAQVSVEGTVNGHPFDGLAFPTSDGTHFLNLNTKLRRRLVISEGDRLEFIIRRRAPAEDDVMPPELARALASAPRNCSKARPHRPPASPQDTSDLTAGRGEAWRLLRAV